jgi:hypothetical protein
MVREPLSWAKSIATFKASKNIRPFIDFIPFNSPYPVPRPPGWRDLDLLEQQLWRWRFCNEQILRHRDSYATYCLARYEDLFSAEKQTRQATIDTILDTLQICSDGDDVYEGFSQRVNAAPKRSDLGAVTLAKARSICGELMSTFGYD